MSRYIIPQRTGLSAAPAGAPPDGPIGRIVKYVPAEIVSIYTIVVGGFAAATHANPDPSVRNVVAWLILIFFLGTVVYMWRTVPAGPVRTAQMIVSPLAFLAWAYPISSMLLGDWFNGIYSIAAQAVVLLLGLIVAPKE